MFHLHKINSPSMSIDSVVNHHTRGSYGPQPANRHSLPLILILTVVLLFFFLLGFFSIYLCRCLMGSISNIRSLRRRNNARGEDRRPGNGPIGLDPSIISSFPTFLYSAVKDIRKGKSVLECAVCLMEFADDDVLRLLTVCNHAFHPECIDLWLASHKTCPVCRRNLDSAEKTSTEVSFPVPETDVGEERGEDNNNSHRISFKEEEEEMERRGGGNEADRIIRAVVERFPRSHSTGHSLVRSAGEDDRFTLLLPENVKERITKGRNWTGSCITFGDFSGDVVTEKFEMAKQPGISSGGVTGV